MVLQSIGYANLAKLGPQYGLCKHLHHISLNVYLNYANLLHLFSLLFVVDFFYLCFTICLI
jgi:hypothetical protein